MSSKQPFARRIVIAFVLLTVLVSGAFSLSIVAVVHFIEQRLVSEEMHRELNGVLHEDLKNGRAPRLDARTRFYASNLPEYAIPERYAGLDEGFTELVDNDQAFYAYAQEINGVRYVLVQDQDEFEAHEQALFDVVLAGFILTVLGAWALGRVMAGRSWPPSAAWRNKSGIVINCCRRRRRWHRNIRMTRSVNWRVPLTARWGSCASHWSVNGCLPATSAMNCGPR
jgi:hypothetical protein